jgi:hypothetical protein
MSGVRGRIVTNPGAEFELAVRLREQGAPLGEIFGFVSGLYFRGKSMYASAFAASPPGVPGSLVITAGRGLLSPETVIKIGDLMAIAAVPIELSDPRYRDPLVRDASRLNQSIPPSCQVVLLGSIATSKYMEPLIDIFGSRLLIPSDFIGRGDMSRGGLMLLCVRARVELDYITASSALRRGRRRIKHEVP